MRQLQVMAIFQGNMIWYGYRERVRPYARERRRTSVVCWKPKFGDNLYAMIPLLDR